MDKGFWSVGLIGVVAMAGYFYLQQSGGPSEVTYEVTGDGTASSITYMTSSGISQSTDVNLPWSTTVFIDPSMASVVAQAGSTMRGITCSVNGDGVSSFNHSAGASAVVTCGS